MTVTKNVQIQFAATPDVAIRLAGAVGIEMPLSEATQAALKWSEARPPQFRHLGAPPLQSEAVRLASRKVPAAEPTSVDPQALYHNKWADRDVIFAPMVVVLGRL
jgi:hypothetical protein